MTQNITLLDAHVHIYDCYSVSDLFDRAASNFETEFKSRHNCDRYQGVLFLTESAPTQWFTRARDSINTNDAFPWGNWRIELGEEAESIHAISRQGERLIIIAGRQIITAEKLEVLALGLTRLPDDGNSITETMTYIHEAGALCVLPWGFGKWLGTRGKVIQEILSGPVSNNLFLGDNSGRLGVWPAPSEFTNASRRGIPILPGTDPLPFTTQISKVASFGFAIDTAIDSARPFQSIKQYLLAENRNPVRYGKLENPFSFVKNQLKMQAGV